MISNLKLKQLAIIRMQTKEKIMKEYNKYSDEELKGFWAEFGNVPINEDDEIDTDFYFFSAGTERMEIWQWFDMKFSKGVADPVQSVHCVD